MVITEMVFVMLSAGEFGTGSTVTGAVEIAQSTEQFRGNTVCFLGHANVD